MSYELQLAYLMKRHNKAQHLKLTKYRSFSNYIFPHNHALKLLTLIETFVCFLAFVYNHMRSDRSVHTQSIGHLG